MHRWKKRDWQARPAPSSFWHGIGWAVVGSLMFWVPVLAGLFFGGLR